MKLRIANKIVDAVANESDKGRYSDGKIGAALRRVERTVESKRADEFWHVAMNMLRKASKEDVMSGDHYDEPYEEPECTICGSCMDWQECHDCDDGYWDAYDDDPINESPGTVVCCHHCHGNGGYWECSALPHTDEQMAAHAERKEEGGRG